MARNVVSGHFCVVLIVCGGERYLTSKDEKTGKKTCGRHFSREKFAEMQKKVYICRRNLKKPEYRGYGMKS